MAVEEEGTLLMKIRYRAILLHLVPPDHLHQIGACFSVNMALKWERTSDQADRFILTEKFCNLYNDQPLGPDYWPVDFESPLGSHTELCFLKIWARLVSLLQGKGRKVREESLGGHSST